MQNRYVGDIGDYVKLAILRNLCRDKIIGIAWWLFPDESHNRDGRHLSYLDNPAAWRGYDPPLFDFLFSVRTRNVRNIRELEKQELYPGGAVFASELIPCLPQIRHRQLEREQWFSRVKECLQNTQFIFVDPDNGIAPRSYRVTKKNAGKSITTEEISELIKLKVPILVYHHHTRFEGGHLKEIEWLAAQLTRASMPLIGALRASPWSPRLFLLLGDDVLLANRAAELAQTWHPHITWHPTKAMH